MIPVRPPYVPDLGNLLTLYVQKQTNCQRPATMITQEKDILARLDEVLSSSVTRNPEQRYVSLFHLILTPFLEQCHMHFPRWLYIDSRCHDYTAAEQTRTSQLALVKRMKNEWRSERLKLPTTWDVSAQYRQCSAHFMYVGSLKIPK